MQRRMVIDVRKPVDPDECTVCGQLTDRAEVIHAYELTVHVHWCDWCWRRWACGWRREVVAKYPDMAARLGVVS